MFVAGLSDQIVVDVALIKPLRHAAGQAQFGIQHRTTADRGDIGAAIIIRLEVISDQADFCRAIVVIDDPACAIMFIPVHVFFLTAEDVGDVAIIGAVKTGNPAAEVFAQRAGNCRAKAIFIAFKPFGARFGFQSVSATLGNHVDEARRSVFAEQGALRPAQNFDPFKINKIHECLTRTRQHDAIDNGGHTGFGGNREGDRAHAAHHNRAVGAGGTLAEGY